MSESKIFHYTTIESLAMILKTKKLRFTRLDRVDDVREAQSHVGIDFGKYFFVSCWTRQSRESIPQWNMYGYDMRGVRVELPVYPFRRIRMEGSLSEDGVDCRDEIYGPVGVKDLCGSTYCIVPAFHKPEFFSGPVNYVSDVEERYAKAIRRVEMPEGRVKVEVNDLYKLPRLKSDDWSFQDEYRFHLHVLPLSMRAINDARPDLIRFAERSSELFLNNVDPGVTYIDLDLDVTSLDQMVVRLGPQCTPGGRACVEALVSKHVPKARIEESALSGSVRSRFERA